jgi:hypothetical protein
LGASRGRARYGQGSVTTRSQSARFRRFPMSVRRRRHLAGAAPLLPGARTPFVPAEGLVSEW